MLTHKSFFLLTIFLFILNLVNLGEKMGWEATLPYLSPELRGKNLLVGANFASAGVGVLNDTGYQFVSYLFISKYMLNCYIL